MLRSSADKVLAHFLRHFLGLFQLITGPPARAAIACRAIRRHVSQGVFDRRFLSSAASTAAYSTAVCSRTGVRMKKLSPADFLRYYLKPVAPFNPCLARQMMRLGAGRGARSAPLSDPKMHRPEGLNGLAALVRGQDSRQFLMPFSGDFELLGGLFSSILSQRPKVL